jgi:hypothetical protein
LDEKHEQPSLDQNQKILDIKKANVNFWKEKFEQKHAVPQSDETEMFYLSTARTVKHFSSTDQAWIRI